MRFDEVVTKLQPGQPLKIITEAGIYSGKLVEWTDQGVVLKTRKGTVYLNPLIAGIEALFIPNPHRMNRKNSNNI